MKDALRFYEAELNAIREAGTYKDERIITTPQRSRIDTTKANGVLNLCANNYLGLADSAELIAAAKASYDRWGFGLASVRFICGTQDLHRELETRLAGFLGMEDAILYSSCFDANGGLFETLLGPEDAVISDELNHASIIDGVRLCKAQRLRYKNNDMADLRAKLEEAAGARIKLIATDGVFSMDGIIADLPAICDLAEEYGALLMVDDNTRSRVASWARTARHAGIRPCGGPRGHTHRHVWQGAGRRLRRLHGGEQDGHRPAPAKVPPLPVFQHRGPGRVRRHAQDARFAGDLHRPARQAGGQHRLFPRRTAQGGPHRAGGRTPHRAGDARRRARGRGVRRAHARKGVYVVSFSYPVVPKGKARFRTQVSAGHSREDLDFAVSCFREVKEEMGL